MTISWSLLSAQERVRLFRYAVAHHHADEIDIPLVGVSLDIEVDLHRTRRQGRRAEDKNRLVPQSHRLKGMIAAFAPLHPFTFPSRSKRVGKLSEGEDALPCIRFDFLFPNAAKQAQRLPCSKAC